MNNKGARKYKSDEVGKVLGSSQEESQASSVLKLALKGPRASKASICNGMTAKTGTSKRSVNIPATVDGSSQAKTVVGAGKSVNSAKTKTTTSTALPRSQPQQQQSLSRAVVETSSRTSLLALPSQGAATKTSSVKRARHEEQCEQDAERSNTGEESGKEEEEEEEEDEDEDGDDDVEESYPRAGKQRGKRQHQPKKAAGRKPGSVGYTVKEHKALVRLAYEHYLADKGASDQAWKDAAVTLNAAFPQITRKARTYCLQLAKLLNAVRSVVQEMSRDHVSMPDDTDATSWPIRLPEKEFITDEVREYVFEVYHRIQSGRSPQALGMHTYPEG